MTPNRLLVVLRGAAVLSALGLTVLLLGPFQGLEQRLGLTDTQAHAMAFFGVTLGLFAIAPRSRRTDLALAALGFGALIELGQAFTGRSASFTDLAADCVGIGVALLPGLVERFRYRVRTCPDLDFAQIQTADRRRLAPATETVIALPQPMATSGVPTPDPA